MSTASDIIDPKQVGEQVRITWRTWTVVAVTGFVFMAQSFATIAAGSVEAFIVRDLGDQPLAGWIIQGPLLMQAVLAPLVGRLSDVTDRKWLASIPTLFGAAGAIIAATASHMPALVGGSILIGITLSTVPIIQAIPAEVLPVKWRVIANATTYIGSAIGGLLGTLGAGAITNVNPSGWRGIFWLQAALHFLSFSGLMLFYHPPAKPRLSSLPLTKLIWLCDPIGSLLFVVGSAALLVALDFAGIAFPWSDAHVLAPLISGLVLVTAFGLYEWKGRDDGLIAHVFFRNGPNFGLACGALIVEGWMFFAAVNNLIPQIILNLGFASNSLEIAIRQLAGALPAMILVIPVSIYATRYKDLKWPLLVGYTIFLAAAICFTVLNPSMNTAQLVFSAIVSAGQSAPLLLLVALVQLATPHAFLSTASGLALSARAIGGAFGSAVLAAIVSARLEATLPEVVGPVAAQAGLQPEAVPSLLQALLSGQPQMIASVPGVTPQIMQALIAATQPVFAHAYNVAWGSVIPFIIVALAAVALLRGVREKLMQQEVEASVEPRPLLSEKA